MDEESSKFAVMNDLFDVETFNRWFDQSSKLKQVLDSKRLVTAQELGQDVFDALYKYTPEVRKPEEIDPAYLFNRSLMEKAMGTQEYEQLRSMTMLQEAESALATTTISENLMKDLPEEDRKAVNDYARAQENLAQAASQLQTLSQQAQLPSNLQQYQAKLQKQLPKLQKAAAQAQAAFDAAGANPQVRAAVRAAINQALQEMNLVNDFAGGWGLGPGQLQKVPVQERLALMQRIQRSKKIHELVKLMGRFKRLAFQRRYTRATTEPNEVVDVTVGDDLARVLPSEVVKLTDEVREDEFYAKYVQRELLVYELKGRESFGRGPIIFCLDNSGSMQDGAGGITREMWAKAVFLAMAEIALKDKRTIEAMNFGSHGELHKYVVEPGGLPQERLKSLMDVAEEFFGGGTDFERPLGEALDDVDKAAFRKADVVMVTDGLADFSEDFLKKFKKVKEKKEFRLHSVIIGGTDESLEKLSDSVHHLHDLLSEGDQVAGDLFEAV